MDTALRAFQTAVSLAILRVGIFLVEPTMQIKVSLAAAKTYSFSQYTTVLSIAYNLDLTGPFEQRTRAAAPGLPHSAPLFKLRDYYFFKCRRPFW